MLTTEMRDAANEAAVTAVTAGIKREKERINSGAPAMRGTPEAVSPSLSQSEARSIRRRQ